MTKEEFEELAGINISDEVYKVIETVYINFDRWNNSKQEFVIFFKKHGEMQAINKLYSVHCKAEILKTRIKEAEEELNGMSVLYGLSING